MKPKNSVFNLTEAARYLNVSRPTMAKLLVTEPIPHGRSGRIVKIRQAVLDRWLESSQ